MNVLPPIEAGDFLQNQVKKIGQYQRVNEDIVLTKCMVAFFLVSLFYLSGNHLSIANVRTSNVDFIKRLSL